MTQYNSLNVKLGDMLFGKKGKGIIRAGEGTIRAGYGSKRTSLKHF